MTNIMNVAVLGATGNLGPHIIKALLTQGFRVTALTRGSSSSVLPEGVEVKTVDFGSQGSIVEALSGQDAVVSAIGTLAVPLQLSLIDAAVSANVKRFIPSEFGVDTRLIAGTKLAPLLQGKLKVVEYLKEKAKQHPEFSWTALATGSLFESALRNGGFGFDLSKRHAIIFDSGDARFSPTSFDIVGKAVAAILTKTDETENQYLGVSSFTTSQTEILKILEKETGTKWDVDQVSTADLEKVGWQKLGEKNPLGAFDLMKAFQFQDGQQRSLSDDASASSVLDLPAEDVSCLIKALV
ncbi:related to 2`-hydroxyisoflavone reductase [Fusarium oxysporum]|uniref:Related to 2`-hydroxyisoflavone reductase n=1 Tax=Fusarium oxysporum TaxID=5507 RepID=A0A2H3TVI6_FUSOX|nr:related to 2`-hydroxyisoflavone reductase [Fusarium oxysporum]